MNASAHESGAKHGYADVDRGQLRCPAFAHSDHGEFRGAIRLHAWRRDHARHRCGIHEVAAFSMAFDQGREDFGAVDDALEVYVDDPVPIALVHRTKRTAHRDAGVVADEMDLAECRHCIERRASHAGTIGDVDEDRCGLDLLGCKSFDRGLYRFFVDVGEYDIHSGPTKRARHTQANAACPACYEGGSPLELFHGHSAACWNSSASNEEASAAPFGLLLSLARIVSRDWLRAKFAFVTAC